MSRETWFCVVLRFNATAAAAVAQWDAHTERKSQIILIMYVAVQQHIKCNYVNPCDVLKIFNMVKNLIQSNRIYITTNHKIPEALFI